MEILEQMVVGMLSRGEVQIAITPETINNLNVRCMQILDRIRKIVADDELDDPECFQRIERIVAELEENGIDCGIRHDFG